MSDIQYPENGKKNVNLKSTDLCGNTRNGVREVNIIQRLLEGQYISILEDGDKATISADVSADYYNKAQINELLGDLDTVKFKVVSALPAVGAENVIYLVPKAAPEVGYEQYIWDSNDAIFYPIGDTDIDLSDYYTKIQSDAKFQELLSNGTGITAVSDTTDFSQVSLGDKTVRQATGLSIWNYIKSKMAGAISTVVEDDVTGNRVLVSTPLGKVTTSSITSEELFTLDDIRSNVQEQIDSKLDKIVMGAETDIMADTTPLTYLDVPNNQTHVTRGSVIWTYIKSKFNADTLSSVTDNTKFGSIDKTKTNPVQETTAQEIFKYMALKMYPVGSIYISVNSTSPATLFGGTWEQIKGRFLVGAGNNGESGNANLNKSLGTTGGTYRHQHTYGLRHNVYYGQGANSTSDSDSIQLANYSTTNSQSWKSGSQNGNAQGRHASWSGEGSLSRYDVTAETKLTDSLPPYLAVNIWKRTA